MQRRAYSTSKTLDGDISTIPAISPSFTQIPTDKKSGIEVGVKEEWKLV